MTRDDDAARLQVAVDRLYAVFAQYRQTELAPALPACSADSHEMEDVRRKLTAKEADHLTAYDLLDYYYLAIDHVGSVDDLKHYLPRILDEMRRKPDILVPAHLTTLFQSAELKSWPAHERAAVLEYVRMLAAVGLLAQKDRAEIEASSG